MNIIADKEIPFINSFFDGFDNFILLDSEEISCQTLADADVLIVRTVTKVNQELLQGTPVKFVATATSGHDHIDIDYLKDNGISFVNASGCNSRSVAEYVLSSLFVLADKMQFHLEQKSLGIIGFGNVGSTIYRFTTQLGMKCFIYDPPRQENDNSIEFSKLEDIQKADIITLHVPLIDNGPYPTSNLLDSDFFSRLKSDVILINTSRGGVVDENALSRFIDLNPSSMVVLDVWKNEPEINMELLKKVYISTPHIAGYSLDAKLKGTRIIFKQICEAIGKSYKKSDMIGLPKGGMSHINLIDCDNEIDAIKIAVLSSYDVSIDSVVLKELQNINADNRGNYFLDKRKNYPLRREFTSTAVSASKEYSTLKYKMETLGFRMTYI